MEITKDFAFHILACVAMAPTLLIHHGDPGNLGTFPDGFLSDGEFTRLLVAEAGTEAAAAR